MSRPTVDAVTTGFDTTLDDPEVDDKIDDAGVLLRKAYDEGELADADETALWKYLVRHLIRFTVEDDREKTREQLGSAQADYSGRFTEMLRATSAGQTALMYDEDDRFRELQEENEDLFLDVH